MLNSPHERVKTDKADENGPAEARRPTPAENDMSNFLFTSISAQLGLGAASMITNKDTVILGISIVNT